MEQFLKIYQDLSLENIESIEEIYTQDIRFIDPAHEIEGLAALRVYFENLYKNIDHIHFDFLHPTRTENEGYVQWTMTFSHPRIKGGQSITVPGTSFFKFSADNKVCFHRDYFDLGSMLYQHLPLLGTIIKSINRRLGS
jgi:hypothetical protein